MARIEVFAPPDELLRIIEAMSRGHGYGVVIVPGSRWHQLEEAYNSKLMKDVHEVSVDVAPRRSVPDNKLDFRLWITPDSR